MVSVVAREESTRARVIGHDDKEVKLCVCGFFCGVRGMCTEFFGHGSDYPIYPEMRHQ